MYLYLITLVFGICIGRIIERGYIMNKRERTETPIALVVNEPLDLGDVMVTAEEIQGTI